MGKTCKVVGVGLLAFGLAVSSPGISDVLIGDGSHRAEAASGQSNVIVKQSMGTKYFNKKSALRVGRSSGSKAVLFVKPGHKAEILDVYRSWTKVKVGTRVGWTPSRDLSISAPVVEQKVIDTKLFIKKSALRTSRSTRGKAVLFVKPGHVAKVYEVYRSWSKVQVGTKVGWVPTRDLIGMKFEIREVFVGGVVLENVGDGSAVLTELPVGSYVELVRTSGSWSQVRVGSVVGWVPSSVLSVQKIERGDADMIMNRLSQDARFEYVPARDEFNSAMYVRRFAEFDKIKFLKNRNGKLIVNHWFGDAYKGTSRNSEMREDLMSKQYVSIKETGDLLYGKGSAESTEYATIVTGHVKEIEKLIASDWHNRMGIRGEGTFEVDGDTYQYIYGGPSISISFE